MVVLTTINVGSTERVVATAAAAAVVAFAWDRAADNRGACGTLSAKVTRTSQLSVSICLDWKLMTTIFYKLTCIYSQPDPRSLTDKKSVSPPN